MRYKRILVSTLLLLGTGITLHFAFPAIIPAVATVLTGGDGRSSGGKSRFTVSKETTYFTAPLDNDGHVDYLTALNERWRQGVIRENNANVLLFQAIGPRPEKQLVPAEFFRWAEMDPPPEKGAYFVTWTDYFKAHSPGSKEPSDKDEKLFDLATRQVWSAKQYPQIAAWLAANEKPLVLVVEASKRSHYYAPLQKAPTKEGPADLMGALLPYVQKNRDPVNALLARAMFRVAQKRFDDAWQDLLACHRLGRLVSRGGTLIESLVGYAIDRKAAQADVAFLSHYDGDANRIQGYLRDLQQLPAFASMSGKIDLGERCMMLNSFMLFDFHGIDYLDVLGGSEIDRSNKGLWDSFNTVLANFMLRNVNWDMPMRDTNQWYDRVIAALCEKDRATMKKKLVEFDRDLSELKAEAVDREAMREEMRRGKPAAEAFAKRMGGILICLVMPAISKVLEVVDRAEQTERNLHVAFALAAYRRDHGRYPVALDALSPKYLATIPQDLFMGKPLVYRPKEDGYLLYSLGRNEMDDGGHTSDDDPNADDVAIQMIAPLPAPKHVKVYSQPARFGGWPANHGIWIWNNEILVGFSAGYYKDNGPTYHAIDHAKPEEHLLARSRDGGETWTIENPAEKGMLIPEGKMLHGIKPPGLPETPWRDCSGGIDFTHPDFAMTVRMTDNNAGPSRFYYSTDRGHNWAGPFRLPLFGQKGILGRTDYVVNGKHDCTLFLTASKQNGREGRPLCVRTTDGGKTWNFVGWIGPEPKGYAIMPTTLRLDGGELLSAIRRNDPPRHWLETYRSLDDGKTWKLDTVPAPDLGEGNPASMIRLKDGRVCLTYGYRAAPYGIRAKLSSDGGKTWGEEIILRDDGGNRDGGYPRTVQRPDGKVVTIYYLWDKQSGTERYIAATIWDPGSAAQHK